MRVAAAAACCVALAACSTPAKPIDGTLTLEIPAANGDAARTADGQRRDAQLKLSDRVVVRLGAQAGTGFAWELAGPAPAVLSAEGPPTTAPESAEGHAVGAGTWTTFQFLAVGQGRGDLRFVLRRPWEASEDFARQINICVEVRPAEPAAKDR